MATATDKNRATEYATEYTEYTEYPTAHTSVLSV